LRAMNFWLLMSYDSSFLDQCPTPRAEYCTFVHIPWT
jgi:hypothetical protein